MGRGSPSLLVYGALLADLYWCLPRPMLAVEPNHLQIHTCKLQWAFQMPSNLLEPHAPVPAHPPHHRENVLPSIHSHSCWYAKEKSQICFYFGVSCKEIKINKHLLGNAQVTWLELGDSLVEGPLNTCVMLYWIQKTSPGVFICKWVKWLFSLMKKEKVEKGSWGEDSKTAKEEGTEVMYYQANRQEGRVRHTEFDFELWILPLMWFPPSGRSCVILHSQGSSIKWFSHDPIRNYK